MQNNEKQVAGVRSAVPGFRLNRSFRAKLIQSSDQAKEWYGAIKNEILSYEGVENVPGWGRDSFRFARATVARIVIRSKAICIYLPVPTSELANAPVDVQDISSLKSAGKMTARLKIVDDACAKYAPKLVASAMKSMGIEKGETKNENYLYPYEEDEALIEKELIKLRPIKPKAEKVAAAEEVAATAKRPAKAKQKPVGADTAPAAQDTTAESASAKAVEEEKAEVIAESNSEPENVPVAQEETAEEPTQPIEEENAEPTAEAEPEPENVPVAPAEAEPEPEEEPAAQETVEEPAQPVEEEKTEPTAEPESEPEEEPAAQEVAEEPTQPIEEEKAELTAEPESEPENAALPPPLLQVRGLKKYFPIKKDFFGRPKAFLRAVDNVSFDLERGKTLGIVGESGCGKTTMGRTILKLHEPTGGEIYFDGTDIAGFKPRQLRPLRTRMQIIFQDPYSSLPPRMPVGSIIGEAVKCHKLVPNSQLRSYVLDIMDKCGLRDYYYDRYPHEFSGGQRQRICIARALAVKPELIVCDEPVSALDVSIQAQIINLLKDLQKSMGLTYLFISHDLSVVKHISDSVGVMYLGSMVEFGSNHSIFSNPMHPYTRALFSAVPVPDPKVKMKRIILSGDIPSPANPPAGCKFHTRCPECMEVCKSVAPVYREYEEGHFVACHLYPQE